MESRHSIRLERLVEVLAQTAADLTRLKDTEGVLAAICGRTRLLIDSDMAYISLNDTALGETYIRATDGVRSEAYRSIRMPLGTGVLGAAATGERTFMTTDYSSDNSIVHIRRIDEAVEAEGVRAILAAPLKIEGTVIGALLVADRSARHFLPEEQLIIESLAPLAAVAVENARRFEDQREALEREREARAEASANLAKVRRLATAEQAFSDALSSSAGFDALLDELQACLARDAVAFDAHGQVVASTRPSAVDAEVISAIREALREARDRNGAAPRGQPGHHISLARAHGSVLGGILVLPGVSPERVTADPETDSTLLTRASSHLATLMLFQRTIDDSRYRQERDLMSALAVHDPADDPRPLERSVRKLSTGAEIRVENRAILVIELGQEDHFPALRRLRDSRMVSIVASHDGHVCGLIDATATRPSDVARALGDIAVAMYGGVSPLPKLESAAQAHTEAHGLARALLQLGRSGEVADRGSLGSVGLLLGAGGNAIPEEIVAAQLGPLLAYDAAHGTTLTETCEAWLECGRSVSDTAASLFVHTNTVRQRLDRITAVLGEGWADGSRALDLHLALRVRRISFPGHMR